jgi:hypothetical protein
MRKGGGKGDGKSGKGGKSGKDACSTDDDDDFEEPTWGGWRKDEAWGTVGGVSVPQNKPVETFAAVIVFMSAMMHCVSGLSGGAASKVFDGVSNLVPMVSQAHQANKHHKESIDTEEKLAKKAMRQNQQHQFNEIKTEMKNHMEQVAVDLREAAKEADRDNWEQRHSMFGTLITSASVMLGGSCSVIVEGIASLPSEGIAENEHFQLSFSFFLGLSYGLLFMCILLAMVRLVFHASPFYDWCDK